MTVHTKWEILVQKLLKSVELFKSYGLFGEPKVVDFLFFVVLIELILIKCLVSVVYMYIGIWSIFERRWTAFSVKFLEESSSSNTVDGNEWFTEHMYKGTEKNV
jgi:hypothetical protein